MNLVWKKKKEKNPIHTFPLLFTIWKVQLMKSVQFLFMKIKCVTLKLCVFPLKTAAYSIF